MQRAAGSVAPAPAPETSLPPVSFERALAFGDVFALNALWIDLGLGDAIRRALRSSRRSFDAEALVRAPVFNRLCEPDSKLGCLEWLETVSIPGMPAAVTHDQLLRTMDALMDHPEAEVEVTTHAPTLATRCPASSNFDHTGPDLDAGTGCRRWRARPTARRCRVRRCGCGPRVPGPTRRSCRRRSCRCRRP